MNREEMRNRTKDFPKRIIRVCRSLPNTREAYLIGGQLFRAGTSVGANYRAACRGRSKLDFINKLGIALEEADESLYWLEILAETKIIPVESLRSLMIEADEIVSILVASINTARKTSKI